MGLFMNWIFIQILTFVQEQNISTVKIYRSLGHQKKYLLHNLRRLDLQKLLQNIMYFLGKIFVLFSIFPAFSW